MLKIIDLGLKEYKEVWDLQKSLQQKLINGYPDDYLIVCSHQETITLGKSSKKENILLSEKELNKQLISVYEIERGGDVTWHGPQQIILYPILNLKRHKTDVAWYLRQLEMVIISTLDVFSIPTKLIAGKTGVWIDLKNKSSKEKKIAAMGVRISRWCTLHGLSLNVLNCQKNFNIINPCGFSDIESTSIEDELKLLANHNNLSQNLYDNTKNLLIDNFVKAFSFRDTCYEKTKN